jgi:hypothetical protein
MTDEYVTPLEYVENGIEAIGHGRLFVNPVTVAWDVDGDCPVAEAL